MFNNHKFVVIHNKIAIINKKIEDLLKPKVLKNKFIKPTSFTLKKIKTLEDEKNRLVYLMYYLADG